ncbi:unnamed protein product, partial [marine sediment metagenome]
HREVFYLGPSGRDARTEGFARAFRDRKLRPPEAWAPGNYRFSTADGRRAARDLLARRPGATAAFACSDRFAYGVLAELAARGVDVPGKISVIGFDDRSPSQFVSPPLSTVAHPHEEVGKLAAEVLLGKIGGTVKPGEGSRTAVPRFVERESTRALAGSE